MFTFLINVTDLMLYILFVMRFELYMDFALFKINILLLLLIHTTGVEDADVASFTCVIWTFFLTTGFGSSVGSKANNKIIGIITYIIVKCFENRSLIIKDNLVVVLL